VKTISWRAQLGMVAAGYACVTAVAACLLFRRYLQELNNPADVAAAGGMYAAGDAMLAIFIACLFMIPTAFLIAVIARFERVYTTYAQVLLGVSLTAPVCLSLLLFGRHHLGESLSGVCLSRIFAAPFVLLVIGISRLVARFDRARKLTSYALAIEGVTLVTAVGIFIRG